MKRLGISALLAALAVGTVACGGATPAPKAHAAQTQTTSATNGSGCDAIRGAFAAMAMLDRPAKDEKGSEKTPANPSSAEILRLFRTAQEMVATLDAALDDAANDPSLVVPAKEARAGLRKAQETNKTAIEIVETRSRTLAKAYAELMAAENALPQSSKPAPNDPDMGALLAAFGQLDEVRFDDAKSLDNAAASVAKLSFRSTATSAARDRVVSALVAMGKLTRTVEADLAALKDARDPKALVTALTPIAKACHLDDKAPARLPPTGWIAAKQPDLRKQVVVVHVEADRRIATRLREWAAQSEGQRRSVFENSSYGAFGSGFFVVPRKGDVLIVTNRHVVELGDRATIEMGDGTKTPAEILYTDPRWDLAVLRPEKPLVEEGLALDLDAARDQQAVIATGYPGVGGRPSYQTAPGHVSNQSFLATEGVPYVQHTAPVDRGGSGGPLTTEQGTVLGVNTLKIADRENVAMAVPAAAIAHAVARAEAPERDAVELRASARAACVDLLAELSSEKPRMFALYHAISNSMVGDVGSSSFNAIAQREKGLEPMLLRSPIMTLRLAVAARLIETARNVGLNPFETCSTPEREDWENIASMDRVRFNVGTTDGSVPLVLRREHGGWKMVRFDLPAPQESGMTGLINIEPKPGSRVRRLPPPAASTPGTAKKPSPKRAPAK